ncbi:hypothetical protein D1J60_00715 [Streptomyces sp. W1SF4]|nr:hypothetical protein D1J60_00715 [Streptomyces sp. W1SF4]
MVVGAPCLAPVPDEEAGPAHQAADHGHEERGEQHQGVHDSHRTRLLTPQRPIARARGPVLGGRSGVRPGRGRPAPAHSKAGGTRGRGTRGCAGVGESRG